jgi:hypothetical protein
MAPAATTFGASSREAYLPLENRARSRPSKEADAESSTSTSPSSQGRRWPADRAEAKYRMLVTGNERSTSNDRMTPPT